MSTPSPFGPIFNSGLFVPEVEDGLLRYLQQNYTNNTVLANELAQKLSLSGGTISGNILTNVNNTLDIGELSNGLKNLYTDNLFHNNGTAYNFNELDYCQMYFNNATSLSLINGPNNLVNFDQGVSSNPAVFTFNKTTGTINILQAGSYSVTYNFNLFSASAVDVLGQVINQATTNLDNALTSIASTAGSYNITSTFIYIATNNDSLRLVPYCTLTGSCHLNYANFSVTFLTNFT